MMKLQMGTVVSQALDGAAVQAFATPELALKHVQKHFLQPGECWRQILQSPLEFKTHAEFQRHLGGPAVPLGQQHYDLFRGAIGRALAEAERARLWLRWEEVGRRHYAGSTPPPKLPRALHPGATWVSPYGVRVEADDGQVRTALRCQTHPRLRETEVGREWCDYMRFAKAFDFVRKRMVRPSYLSEGGHIWRYQRGAQAPPGSPLQRGGVSFLEWITWIDPARWGRSPSPAAS